ncbi:Crp/Fnr family transcriptional regulator [Sunxiuqinia elliptica]|uniref:cAMP-binding domain of CRP or a regulatory subunit of cAMP-dependent protein kinases n=1 Tax=Sunxiuqinia elliptica TaxID=655355 RepID=A0A1I2J2D0_9BACT|nr:Crp/Fnr family transcriptional regulator [Sunxiuqinia elliptica]SFF46891.1 cAMP-binding domain of CRP or a regulatory subunit of cAMP-dependent protein kinases [Sunxiuqinia elliptica]
MKDSLFEKAYQYPTILKEEYDEIKAVHTQVAFSKNDLIISSGERCNEYYLVEQGLFRSFVFNYSGDEITTDFFIDGDVLIDVSSLFQRIPAMENIQALSDGVLWKIEYPTFQELFHKIEGFREWGRAWMASQLLTSKQRSIGMITLTATERYLNLLREKPQIIKQVPLKHIATYLGITDTSLSRIRKEIAKEA